MSPQPSPSEVPLVSVIVPARNEEASLGVCLRSLLAQSGVSHEIVVVDDASTDGTRAIAAAIPGVRAIGADPLPPGCSGKCNAAQTGANAARGEWLLFTDADTVHEPGSLANAIAEAKQHRAALLSYSPRQEVRGFWERAVMPVVFAELAAAYSPAEICDPASTAAAANGQFLLIRRDVYQAIGGHAAFGHTLLEDVVLARAVKQRGHRLRFRYSDSVRSRMYRSFGQMREGWTKNLALLFPETPALAGKRTLEFAVIAGGLAAFVIGLAAGEKDLAVISLGIAALIWLRFLRRIRRAHFGSTENLLAIAGLPVFVYLLLRSRLSYQRRKQVAWKGRMYSVAQAAAPAVGEVGIPACGKAVQH